MILLILVIILAAAGGFLGDLLKLAGWIIAVLAIMGAVAAYFIHRTWERFKTKV